MSEDTRGVFSSGCLKRLAIYSVTLTSFPMVRQHVNPLLSRFATRPDLFTSWSALFENPTYPLFLDIGCAKGALLKALAMRRSKTNFLGIEIREEPLDYARKAGKGLGNLAYLSTNLEFSAHKWWAPSLSTLSSPMSESLIDANEEAFRYPGELMTVSILMPDPQFKNRHKKRRTLSPGLLQVISDRQPVNGRLVFQTDVFDLFQDMKSVMDASTSIYRDETDILLSTPLFDGIESEREAFVKKMGGKIYAKSYLRL